MKEITAQVLMLAGFAALVYLSLQSLKINTRILPPATFVGPVKLWRMRRDYIKKYKRAALHDPSLENAIRKYLISFRILCAVIALFEIMLWV